MKMNIDEIKEILPHRDNMLLLDKVEYEEGGIAHGYYKIPDDAWFLKGHFPGAPVVPGVILCEILAQSTCVLLKEKADADKLPMYTGLNNVRFKSPVRPGDLFETKCQITKEKYPFFFAKGEGYVDGRLCVKAEFSFAFTER